jgi:hypothetical protein
MFPKSEDYNVNVHTGMVGHWCLPQSLGVNWTLMLEWYMARLEVMNGNMTILTSLH